MGYVFGLIQGVRHALEPDHLAAVSTVVAEQRSARTSLLYSVCWGVGHALTLLFVGGALHLLRERMPASTERAFELAVAIMLIALGVRAIRMATRLGLRGERVTHRHGAILHAHPSPGEHVHWRGLALARRPLLIGVVHGLAGSGAMTVLIAGRYASRMEGLAFILVYGIGATLGMAALAGLAGVPLARAMRTRLGPPLLLGTAGVFSLTLGFLWGWPLVQAMSVG